MPVKTKEIDGILTVTLDTPDSSVNIFNHSAAERVTAVMASVDPSRVRAVVFRSAKPYSFVNGASLMFVSLIRSLEDGIRLTQATRAAYEAVARCPVPTIAAVEGNCFGCGVEFTLNCDYRIACETFDTQFYMTEINDYLLIPGFGGTQRLPHMVGIAKAIDFVIWGERWSATQAHRFGLVDQVFKHGSFDQGILRFVKKVGGRKRVLKARRNAKTASVREARRKAGAKIAALPPRYHEVYSECLSLVCSAAEKTVVEAGDFRREVESSAGSVTTPAAKAALAFFFIRQAAQSAGTRRWAGDSCDVMFPENDTGAVILRKELERRKLRGYAVRRVPTGGMVTEGASAVYVMSSPTWKDRGAHKRQSTLGDGSRRYVTVSCHFGQSAGDDGACLYAPFLKSMPIAELIAADGAPELAPLLIYLGRAGIPTIVTRRLGRALTDRLVAGYLGPLAEAVLAGASPDDLVASLREFGFTRFPRYLLTSVRGEETELAALLAAEMHSNPGEKAVRSALARLNRGDWSSGRARSSLLVPMRLSLLYQVRRAMADGVISRPSQADVLARDVLDFPLGEQSLCSHLSVACVRDLMGEARASRLDLAVSWIREAEAYLDAGKDFYATPGATHRVVVAPVKEPVVVSG